MRTALALVSVAFTLLDYALDYESAGWRWTYWLLGALFVACVDLTWLTGWARYRRVKEVRGRRPRIARRAVLHFLGARRGVAQVLQLPRAEIGLKRFDRFRMRHQAHMLGALLAALLVVYLPSSWRYVS